MIVSKKYSDILFSIVNKTIVKLFVIITILGLVSSCSNTKFLPKNDKLYTSTWYKWKGKKNIEQLPFKVYDIVSTGTVRTNRNFITLTRLNLTFYNYLKPSRSWGFRHYLWSVLSKPPVLMSKVKPENRLLKIRQLLFNRGHFDSSIDLKLKYFGKNDKKVRAIYTITFKDSYKFRDYKFYSKKTSIDSLINECLSRSYILSGDEYWLANVKNERQRITDYLRNRGYFFFKPDYLIFDMDTTVGKKQIDVALRIKNNIIESDKQQYKIGNIDVFFNANKDSISNISLIYDSINNLFYQKQNFYRQKFINREISLLKDSVYKLDNHNVTLDYLMSFGIFKMSEILYTKDTVKLNTLNTHIFLVPRKPITTSLEMNFATKSNDFMGPMAVMQISHDNIFKGAERLSFQDSGGMEWQKASKRREYDLGVNSYEIGVKTQLEFPRFLVPFRLNYKNKRYIPKTYIIFGFKSIKRVKYYNMSLSHANFGYKWRPNKNVSIKLEPVTYNYIRMLETSPEFTEYLQQYPSVARGFEEQLIIGSTYNLTMQKHSKTSILKNYYNSITIDLAGNIINMFVSNKNSLPNSENVPNKIFDMNYSQYFKITDDFRYYLTLSPKSQLVARVIGGIGVPYNKSLVLPYIKQFFAGGSNDLRAFYARTVGPGSYKKEYTSNLLLDQSGEIKIAGNLEYRFPLTYKLSGALFVDAGNVWLLNNDTSRLGGKFEINKFYKQIAIGGGVGARVDLDYVIIRLDVAIPLRKPYKEFNNYWTFTSPHLFSDYILSFAIGYPF